MQGALLHVLCDGEDFTHRGSQPTWESLQPNRCSMAQHLQVCTLVSLPLASNDTLTGYAETACQGRHSAEWDAVISAAPLRGAPILIGIIPVKASPGVRQVLYDEQTEQVFLMLHSGSRNIGNTTAQHYDKAAARDMKQRGIQGPSGLNYLELASQDGQAYLQVRFT